MSIDRSDALHQIDRAARQTPGGDQERHALGAATVHALLAIAVALQEVAEAVSDASWDHRDFNAECICNGDSILGACPHHTPACDHTGGRR